MQSSYFSRPTAAVAAEARIIAIHAVPKGAPAGEAVQLISAAIVARRATPIDAPDAPVHNLAVRSEAHGGGYSLPPPFEAYDLPLESTPMFRWLQAPLLVLVTAFPAQARVWTDSSGKYSVEADLIARDERRAILQRGDHHLVEVPLESLSAKDAEYLKSHDAQSAVDDVGGAMQTWTTRRGLKFTGRIVDYFQRDVVLQKRRGKLYVLDRRYENLPEIYRKIVVRVIEHFQGIELKEETDFNRWVLKLSGKPLTFACQGVVVELPNGDEYGVPFFLFSDADLAVLEPGWKDWQEAKADENARADAAFRVQALAAARARDEQVDRQIAKLQLLSSAVIAGATAVWEVTLYPPRAGQGPPIWAVVIGANSAQATQNALAQNPGYRVGPVRRVTP